MNENKKNASEDQPVLFDAGLKPAPPPEPEPPEEPKPEPLDPTIPMPFAPLSGAEISADGKYRYVLWRRIREKGPVVLFVGLNPSTADHEVDDPTIRAMCEFAKRWGYATVLVGNLFAYRATDPSELDGVEDPVGPENMAKLEHLRLQANTCVACWGNGGSRARIGRHVMKFLGTCGKVHCVGINKTGHPKHPLYVSRKTPLSEFNYVVSSL